MSAAAQPVTVRWLGRAPYAPVFDAMRTLTDHWIAARSASDAPRHEFWLLEHPPVFTQGRAGDASHVLAPGDIPVVQTDRGGQVTYHGPGQLMAYLLLDMTALGLGVRPLVTAVERSVIELLAASKIVGYAQANAPGVYVDTGSATGAKIASLGLRVRGGRSYHGVALNVNLDVEPFSRINPCGYARLPITRTADLAGPADLRSAALALVPQLGRQFGLQTTADWPACLDHDAQIPSVN